jgi:hypothetical protein
VLLGEFGQLHFELFHGIQSRLETYSFHLVGLFLSVSANAE